MVDQRWGETFLCMREKKDGSPVYRVSADKFSFPGRYVLEVDTFWDSMEWTGDCLWGLYPYKNESSKIGGLEVRPNKWSLTVPKGEGVVVLTPQGEIRFKHTPTRESENGEIDKFGTVIRERPGKEISNDYPMFNSCHLKPPDRYYDICVTQLDSPSVSKMEGGVLKINDNRTQKPRVVSWKGITTTDYGNGRIEVTKEGSVAKKIGAKLIAIHNKEIYLFKDGEKLYDYVGGTLEPYETPLLCLNREIYEEMGLTLPSQPACIGFSEEAGYGSFVYVAEVPDSFANRMKKRSDIPISQRVPWDDRIYRYYKRKMSAVSDVSELISFSVLVKQLPLQEKKSLIDKYTEGIPVPEGDDFLMDYLESQHGSRKCVYFEYLKLMGLSYVKQESKYKLPVCTLVSKKYAKSRYKKKV